MSEVQARPAASRGRRGAARGGRTGSSGRGGGRTTTRQDVEDAGPESTTPSQPEDQGELGQLKKQYATQLATLSELFPDWTEEDIVFALQETDGDIEGTVERITSGNVSRFSDVKKKTKEKSRTKAKDVPSLAADLPIASTRGRGRGGLEGGRGGRGRGGSDRGRGGGRGARGGVISALNGTRAAESAISTSTTDAWNVASSGAAEESWDSAHTTSASTEAVGSTGGWESSTTTTNLAKSSLIPEKSTQSWASMLAQSSAKPPKPMISEALGPLPESSIDVGDIKSDMTQAMPAVPTDDLYDTESLRPDVETTGGKPSYDNTREGSIELSPPKDKLTEENVDNLPDSSIPLATETVASTMDGQSNVGSMTPFGSSQQNPSARPPAGGYATSAWRSSGLQPGRTMSYQKKLMEQQEAVVMPGSHSVDRAAVQFGSLGLNGDNGSLDADEEREDVETRAQPPQQSPPSQPRASLPPPPFAQSMPTEHGTLEAAPKQAPGLSAKQQSTPTAAPGLQAPSQSTGQQNQGYDQFSRYGAGSVGQDLGSATRKSHDSFNQQLGYSHAHSDHTSMFPSQSQNSSQPQGQSQLGGYSQGPNDYTSQYSTNDRNAYQSYYGGSYGQQGGQSQHETAVPQRSASGFGVTDSSYSSGAPTQTSSRFAESSPSGHTTPNPTQHQVGSSQYQQGQQQQHQHQQGQQGQQQQSHGHGGHGGGFPGYGGNPYYGGSYYGNYMNQYPNQYSYNQGGYGGHYGAKGNMYGQPQHGYGTSPQTSYDQSTSSAATGGFGGRESSTYGGMNDYSRHSQAQSGQGLQQSGGAFQGQDSFDRSQGGFGNQGQSQQYAQQGGASSEDALKAYPDSKTGPSPTLSQAGRSGSAVNNTSLSGGSGGFAPLQSQQQGFGGGYPAHLGPQSSHNSQYGGLGGLAGHQSSSQSHQTHQSSNYGSYGAGGFSNSYGNYGRGGWGNNYGSH